MHTVAIVATQQVVQRNLPAMERQVDDAIAEKVDAVDLDLSHVQIVDSASLSWMLSIQSRLETLGMRLRLVDPSPIMADILLATRLDSRFTVEVTGAKAAAEKPPGDSAKGGTNAG
jgi:anti-anti-sigma factor